MSKSTQERKTLKHKCEKLWSLIVRQRANWTCQFCGKDLRGWTWECTTKDDGCQGRLEYSETEKLWVCNTCGRATGYIGMDAHHLAGRALTIKYDLTNGIALCKKCHKHYAEDWGTSAERKGFSDWCWTKFPEMERLTLLARKPVLNSKGNTAADYGKKDYELIWERLESEK